MIVPNFTILVSERDPGVVGFFTMNRWMKMLGAIKCNYSADV